jgi:hypothetical protein
LKRLFPGNTDRAVTIELVEASIQLLTLRVCQGDRLRGCRKTLPKLIQKAQPLLGTEPANVYRPHGTSVPGTNSLGERGGPFVKQIQCAPIGGCLIGLGISSMFPNLRIASAMIDCIDDDFIIVDLKDNLVWKPANQGTPHLSMNDRILLRVLLNRSDAVIDFPQEIVTKFAVSFVVPKDRILSIQISR